MLTVLSFNLNSLAQSTQNEIIARINGEDIFQNDFKRLFNAQKKKFYSDLNFDLFSLPTANPKATLKREELIRKAKGEGINASADDFNNAWEDLITKHGALENLEKKTSENLLTIGDIRKKIKENIVLENLFEKQTKEKLIEKIINETLILQEAKGRNINASEEEITNRLNLIKEKQGGEKEFNKFLSENSATVEDAKNEIKNQILIQFVKNQIDDLNTFLAEKKSKSNVIIYTSKIFSKEPAETDLAPAQAVKDIQKMDEETNNILAREILEEEKQEARSRKQEEQALAPAQKDEENKILLSDIKEDTIIQPINVTGKPNKIIETENEILIPGTPLVTSPEENLFQDQKVSIQKEDIQNRMETSSKTLQELRRKIEQRRVTKK